MVFVKSSPATREPVAKQKLTGSPDCVDECRRYLEKASKKVVALSADEQDGTASQILASLADEDAWKKRSSEKRDVIRRIAREALGDDEQSETLPLNDLL